MGFIHTLYYYQVEKSIEDAKKEEMRIAKEKQQQAVNARLNRRQQLMGRRPVNNSPAVNNLSALYTLICQLSICLVSGFIND